MSKEIKNGNVVTKKANGKVKVQLMFDGSDGKTKQEFKDQCQIQSILNKYQKTGMVTHLAKHHAQYGDFSNISDFQSAMSAVANAVDTFESLPSSIRKRFNNDPRSLLGFIEDSSNYEEAVKLGLIEKKLDVSTSSQNASNTQSDNSAHAEVK